MKKYFGKKVMTKTCAAVVAVGLLMTGCASKRGGDATSADPSATTAEGESGSAVEGTTEYAGVDPKAAVVPLDTINVDDYLDMSKLKDLKVMTSEVTASEALIKYNVSTALESNFGFTWEEVDRLVEAGDLVILDYKGYINDIPFNGGSAEDAELGIGSGKFIPGFEEGIIGEPANKEFNVYVTFPENYQEASYSGKDAVFKVTVKKIKAIATPTDEQIKEKSEGKYETYKAFYDATAEQIKQNYHDSILLGKILSVIDEKKEHEGLINEYIQQQLYRVDRACAAAGTDRLSYLNYLGIDALGFESYLKEEGKAYAKQKLAIMGICKQEGLDVIKEGEMDAFKQKLVDQYDELKDVNQLMEIMAEDELVYQLYYERFLEYLKDIKTVDDPLEQEKTTEAVKETEAETEAATEAETEAATEAEAE